MDIYTTATAAEITALAAELDVNVSYPRRDMDEWCTIEVTRDDIDARWFSGLRHHFLARLAETHEVRVNVRPDLITWAEYQEQFRSAKSDAANFTKAREQGIY